MMPAAVSEQVLEFECQGEQLTGILAGPTQPGDTGVVIVVGGPQYRVGSHRQFVLLSRSLAAAGYPTLRFDVRGMGDSGGELRNFEQISEDIDAAIAALMAAQTGLKRVTLWGLCDGASAALMHLSGRRDARIAALCLVNPWVRSEEGLARTQLKHYYLQRLRQGAFWRKLLSGKIARQALLDLTRSLRLARQGTAGSAGSASSQGSFQDRMADGLAGFSGPTLILLSEKDYTAKEFVDHSSRHASWQRMLARAGIEQYTLEDADHTCSDARSQRLLEQSTVNWLGRTFSTGTPA